MTASLAWGCGESDEPQKESGALSAACDAQRSASLDGLPDGLECVGLYRDVAKKELSPAAREYTPAVTLWSDGADKRRWLELPEGTTIDASEATDWVFPIGTKFFKEFSVDERRIETRLFQKVRSDRWARATYEWNEDESAASRSKGGDRDDIKVSGATYSVPTGRECDQCHEGRNERILGFEAVSLGLEGATGLTLAKLVEEQLLSPAPERTALEIGDDGTKLAAKALGWLHVNCGVPCHNDNSNSEGFSTRLRLQLDPAQLDGRPATEFKSVRTTVGVAAETLRWRSEMRIVAGSPGDSLLFKLVKSRAGKNDQMPPIASRVVDEELVRAIESWIEAMREGDYKDAQAPEPETPPSKNVKQVPQSGFEGPSPSDAMSEFTAAPQPSTDAVADAGIPDSGATPPEDEDDPESSEGSDSADGDADSDKDAGQDEEDEDAGQDEEDEDAGQDEE